MSLLRGHLSVHSARSWHFSVKKLQLLNHFQCKSPWGLSLSIFRDIIIALQLLAFFAQNLALYNKSNRVLLSQALCLIGVLGNLMFKLHIIFVVNFSDRAFDRRTLFLLIVRVAKQKKLSSTIMKNFNKLKVKDSSC